MFERMDQNEAIVARFMNDPEFQRAVAASLAREAYQKLGGVQAAREQTVYPKNQTVPRNTKRSNPK
jgi:hypothetical protein